MRLFQNAGLSTTYRKQFDLLAKAETTFGGRLDVFLRHRYGASHFLKPVLDRERSAFVTNGDDDILQRAWAREHGLSASTPLDEILLAQVEEHKTEVFYNLDPMRYGSDFVRRLPSCVYRSICWRAAPSPGADFGAYDLVVNNFPSIIENWRRQGLRAEYFSPAHDPAMDVLASNDARPIDVTFVGGYSRHHTRRAHVLERVAALNGRLRVSYCLDQSRLTRVADLPLGVLPPLRTYRSPAVIRNVARAPVFGLDLYTLLGNSKIVLNGAIDMAGVDRGNMRCFEALGCGALMVSDAGRYPPEFREGENMLTYTDADDAARVIVEAIENWDAVRRIAAEGNRMVRQCYGKDRQWDDFQRLVARS